jgi:hypothetical protein
MTLSGQELNFVMAHEGEHILRRDAAKKCILLFAVCLHWFNPLVWLMAEVCRRDMELNCDRHVLKACGHNARANYARTLLGMEERKRFSGMLMECFSVSPLEERIRSIMAGKKFSLSSTLASIAVYGCAAAMLATSPGMPPAVTTSTVFITATPFAAYDIMHANAWASTVYVTRGDIPAAGQTGLMLAAPYITAGNTPFQKTLSDNAASISVKYGTIAVSTEEVSSTAAAMPAYSMTYTLKDSN